MPGRMTAAPDWVITAALELQFKKKQRWPYRRALLLYWVRLGRNPGTFEEWVSYKKSLIPRSRDRVMTSRTLFQGRKSQTK